MAKDPFDRLTKICRNSAVEISGIMDTKEDNREIYIGGFQIDDRDMIENATSRSVEYNISEYLCDSVYRLSLIDSPVFIRFHTHPVSGVPGLSKADTKILKYLQELATRVYKSNANNGNLVIEGIITRSEIAFYTYDLRENKPVRLTFFVGGIELIPSMEQSVLQRFIEAFKAGWQEVGNKINSKFLLKKNKNSCSH